MAALIYARTQEAIMARKAKEVAPKTEDKKPVEPVKHVENQPAEKGVNENFDQYRAKH